MSTDLVPHSQGSVTIYEPERSHGGQIVVHHHHHYYNAPPQQSSSPSIGGILTGAAGVIGALAALLTAMQPKEATTSHTYKAPVQQYYSPPAQSYEPQRRYYAPPQRRCWYESRREYIGRFFSHREEWPVYDQYGRYRGMRWRDRYVDRWRNYQERVCD